MANCKIEDFAYNYSYKVYSFNTILQMAGFARDIMSYKYYMENVNSEDSETIEKHLHDEKQRYSSKIP